MREQGKRSQQAGIGRKKRKSIKLACRVFALSCPIRAANALRANVLVSVFIRVIGGFKNFSAI
jgi:hypothetical protein